MVLQRTAIFLACGLGYFEQAGAFHTALGKEGFGCINDPFAGSEGVLTQNLVGSVWMDGDRALFHSTLSRCQARRHSRQPANAIMLGVVN
jgi:hypothetical protein